MNLICPHCYKTIQYSLKKPSECPFCEKSFLSAFGGSSTAVASKPEPPVTKAGEDNLFRKRADERLKALERREKIKVRRNRDEEDDFDDEDDYEEEGGEVSWRDNLDALGAEVEVLPESGVKLSELAAGDESARGTPKQKTGKAMSKTRIRQIQSQFQKEASATRKRK